MISYYNSNMFDNDLFLEWLDTQAKLAMEKLNSKRQLDAQEMMFLMLKAQTNHIIHLDQNIHSEMKALREDTNRRFEEVNRRFEEVNRRFNRLYWALAFGFTVISVLIAIFGLIGS